MASPTKKSKRAKKAPKAEAKPSTSKPQKLPKELVARFITDARFRQRLLKNPERTAKAEGYYLTEESIARLRALDVQAVEKLIAEIDDPVAAC